MLQVTQAPTGPVLAQQRFSILGVASVADAGKTLSLVVDDQFRTTGPVIKPDGTWQVDFLFQAAGNRRLRVELEDDSTTVVVQVVATLPQAQQLRFTQIPARLPALQSATVEGTADNFAEGTQLILRSDRKFELARPTVLAGKWRSTIGFNQAGKRVIEILSTDGKIRAETEIDVVDAKPRPPRLGFTNPPQRVQAETIVTLSGIAENYSDDDQLVLRVDQKSELARPQVVDGKWQARTLFRQAGNRLIEIIGSEQDRAQIIIAVQAPATSTFKVLSRGTWTNNPTPADLPNLTPKRITIHHTALSGQAAINGTQTQEAARMRLIYNGHVNGNSWADIGYHFIIMPSGRVYEGRSERKRGSHDVVNDGLGIAFDGVYSTNTISQQQYQAAVALCTVLSKRYGFKNTVTPVPTPTADFGTRNLPLICGHRDRVSTACPGSEGGKTVRLGEIRTAVNAQL
ncbi:N-acetylmuramoyl-L-alanine amidase [Phormidium sp. CLA17]|uniref:peptidoglycan recognition protein family protein n=1 Tax=Leptolyngbya sp. Cla-17 TaxID=2803751 RepID=UPI001933256D|nr:peptidoglycan recognition family protein [Leptolyngbya sp. Cla-17]MBM0740322.1 N-acetylmuramoyl-L-alanine amidase [Leptolyngbya sp. Cla-17]